MPDDDETAEIEKIAGGLLDNLLGPLTKKMGLSWANQWDDRKAKNTERVLAKAEARLEKCRLERVVTARREQLSMRTAAHLLQVAELAEEDVLTEYVAGIMASAYSGSGRDDRAVMFSRLVETLSTFQLRAHWLLYELFFQLFAGANFRIYNQTALDDFAGYFIPETTFNNGMDFAPNEDADSLAWHAFNGLKRQDLVRNVIGGNPDYLRKWMPDPPSAGYIATPSPLGVELFLWGIGVGSSRPNDMLAEPQQFDAQMPRLRQGTARVPSRSESAVDRRNRLDDYRGRPSL